MNALGGLCIVGTLFGVILGCEGGKIVFCSRVVSLRANNDGKKVDLGFGDDDPIGCKGHYDAKLLNSDVHVSKCEDSWVDVEMGSSSYARSIQLVDRSGSLHVFPTTLYGPDGQVQTSMCFRHDVPMGGGPLADDSPRCFNPDGGHFLMYLARTCSDSWCATYWLTAVEGKCDGTQVAKPQMSDRGKARVQQPSQDDVGSSTSGKGGSSDDGSSTGPGSTIDLSKD